MCARALAGIAVAQLAAALPSAARSQEPPPPDISAPRRAFELLDGGDFRQSYGGPDRERGALVPWWRTLELRDDGELHPGTLERVEVDGAWWLVTGPGQEARQPVAAYGPFLGELVLSGRVRGRGALSILDGADGVARFEVGGDGATDFAITGAELAAALGRPARPRLVFALTAAERGGSAQWTGLSARVVLPCPDEATLRADVVARLDEVLSTWLELGRDPSSSFVVFRFDVVTGERLVGSDGGLFPVFTFLLEALEHEDRPTWRAELERFLEEYLTRGLHRDTGLPLRWDVLGDRPLEGRFREPGVDLAFLLDVADAGPEPFRERALAAARRMGETLLARGVAPDGVVAAKYRTSDGAPSLATSPLRRLDVPAQLARLGARTGDGRFTRAARNALAALEYTHHWPGTWRGIDPGFDDDFGHYGARAVTMLADHPDDAAFRALVETGWRVYDPLWRDALRFGGTVATDQVRCWRLLIDYAPLAPGIRPTLSERLRSAARTHFKSQQYKSGAWGDVTFVGFDPKTGIQVGDLPGAPANLLQGLGMIYDGDLGLRTDEVRAMFATLLLTSDEHYRRPYGYLLGPRELPGPNPSGGGLRLCPGLIELLAHLSR